jgi:hypothetical protein
LWRLVKGLEAKALVQPGLCFHGLRHSLGATLFDLGLDRDARKAALGHRRDAAPAQRTSAGAIVALQQTGRLPHKTTIWRLLEAALSQFAFTATTDDHKKSRGPFQRKA